MDYASFDIKQKKLYLFASLYQFLPEIKHLYRAFYHLLIPYRLHSHFMYLIYLR